MSILKLSFEFSEFAEIIVNCQSVIEAFNQDMFLCIVYNLCLYVNLNFCFSRTADQLIQESGCKLDHPAAAKFQAHVIAGEWSKAGVWLNIFF